MESTLDSLDKFASKSPSPLNIPTQNLAKKTENLKISDNATESHECTICQKSFASLNECLRHELLQHQNSIQVEDRKRRTKSMRHKLHTILKHLNQDQKQNLRQELHDALQQCPEQQELTTIIKLYRMNAENMELIYVRVYKCLEKELSSIRGLSIQPFGSIASGLALKGMHTFIVEFIFNNIFYYR